MKIGSVIWCVRSIVAVNASRQARAPSLASITARPRQAIGDDAADERERHARDPEGSEHGSEGSR
jgi:hypothetical protein